MSILKILPAVLLSGMACSANAQSEPTQEFKIVFQAISAKNALSISFPEHIRKMRPLCTARDENDPDTGRKGTASCLGKTGVTALDVTGTASPAVTMIDASISGIDKCTYMRARLVQLYGKPAESTGACNGSWIVKRKGKPIVHIAIEEDKEANFVYFSHQEEQGP